jgi:hypothetical protein
MPLVRRRSVSLLVGAVLLSAGACSDSTAPDTTPLSADESRDLAVQIGALFSQGLAGGVVASRAADASLSVIPVPFGFSVEKLRVPCPEGGATTVTASVKGTIDNATQSITATATGSNTPIDCGVLAQGKKIFITGEFTSEASIRVKDGVPMGENTFSLKGEFSWRTANGRRSGKCFVDYLAKAFYTDNGNSAEVTGDFCGTRMTFSGPITT